jgi:hypothetical protein
VRACALLAVEMSFSRTSSAAAGATELLRGWKVDQMIALLALSDVLERGIGSRGHALGDPPHVLGGQRMSSAANACPRRPTHVLGGQRMSSAANACPRRWLSRPRSVIIRKLPQGMCDSVPMGAPLVISVYVCLAQVQPKP